MSEDALAAWREAIVTAAAKRDPLRIVGGGSKDFLGQPPIGTPLGTGSYRGVIAYEPSELFISARCGTPLAEIETTLEERGQMLAFEPPHFGAATIGGCVAAGLAGPRRPFSGAVRDFVLGACLIDGHGELLRFGGQVMKNVAGYDVSRLLAGSMGILGIIAEVTLKVMPRPRTQTTLELEAAEQQALGLVNRWSASLPVSASSWQAGVLRVRFSGSAPAVASARRQVGGEAVDEAGDAWCALREQRLAFFTDAPDGASLWRLSVPAGTPALALGPQLIEWGGAQRWCWREPQAADEVRRVAKAAGGHATLFRAKDAAKRDVAVFQPLPPALAAIQRRLKQAFDPAGVFNRGRLYQDL